MDQGRTLQGMIRPFPAEMMLGQSMQLTVCHRKQGLQRFLVTALPFLQQLCDLMGRDFGQKPPPFRASQPLFWTKTVSSCSKKVNAAQGGRLSYRRVLP